MDMNKNRKVSNPPCPRCGTSFVFPTNGSLIICRGSTLAPHPSWQYRVGEVGLEAMGPYPPPACKRCQSDLAPVDALCFTSLVPTATLHCERCNILALIFIVEGEEDLIVWEDEIRDAGEPFTDYVRDVLERRRRR